MLIALVWLLTVALFEPNYHRMINSELSRRLTSIVEILEKANSVNAVTDELNDYVKDGICIDISDRTNRCIGISEGIGSNCLLHQDNTAVFGLLRNNQDSDTAIRIRQSLRVQKSINYTIEDATGHQQALQGAVTSNGYTVIVSTNLERVSQAVEVMRSQLVVISVILLVVSIVGALLFARWFTKPITALSKAARKVAAGEYDVAVPTESQDELGVLTRDFNYMTGEVAKSSQLQRELIANISHDLRTPLTLIKGYAETARDLNCDNQERRTDDLNIIIDETDRLSGLVNSVMELSKYSSGTLPPHITWFDLAELARDVLGKYTDRSIKEEFLLAAEGLEEAEVNADPAQIERVLHNLVSNAIAHLGSHGLVTIRLTPVNNGLLRAEVIDNGSGIPESELPHLFDRYYRARSDEGRQGNGLGLSIVKAILVAHSADFGVRSAEGVGSTFWFELPCAAQPEEKPGEKV